MESDPKVNHEEQIAWLTLKLIPGLGNRSILRLVRHFGSAGKVLRASLKDVMAVPGLREQARWALHNRGTAPSASAHWEKLEKAGIRLLCLNDPGYPANLSAIADPPAVLFMQGTCEPMDLVSIAVVGSRIASPMGMAFTERLCVDLAQCGVTVVSGLAVGIDSAAHRGALKGGGRTIAVLGCGLDVDYPRTNSDLRGQISGSGALLSEFLLGTPPAPGHFPLRNRIISGLTLGVVVVEAAHRSGSLITARLALEQGREVFAVPGLAHHYRSTGPHRLLREGAKLVETVEDILEEIRPLIRTGPSPRPPVSRPSQPRPLPEMDSDEEKVMKLLEESPRHIDEICRSIDWPAHRVTAVLSGLELKGAVRQLPGKNFVRA